jgi:hypothetical protein
MELKSGKPKSKGERKTKSKGDSKNKKKTLKNMVIRKDNVTRELLHNKYLSLQKLKGL